MSARVDHEHAAFLASDVYRGADLLPAHRQDLARSGLTAETICAARLRSVPPADLSALLGPRLAGRVDSALLIPYDASGFYRVKLFPPVPDNDGHMQRYHQPADTAPRLYIPPAVASPLADASQTLHFVEGEKKALRGAQEGLACIGIGGLWSWRYDGKIIGDFDGIDLAERSTVLVPDSDVWTRPDLRRAVYALGRALEDRGAKAAVLKLPAGADGAKVGLDDYLCTFSMAMFEKLPRLVLAHKAFTDCATWYRQWVKRGDIAPPSSALALLANVDAVRYLHPAQDVADGVLYYAIPAGETLVIVTSERTSFTSDMLPAGLALRHADVGRGVSLTRDIAMTWLTENAPGSVAAALDGIADYLARHVAFRDRRAPLWLAAWVVGTYCYRAFAEYPYLHLRSAEKACGKTRLMGLLADVSFNSAPPSACPTEAYLFREAERRSGTQCLDEAEGLTENDEHKKALIGILNVGYKRGGSVPRVEKQGERFVTVDYEVYAPRIIAGLSALKGTLESRALSIVMFRRRRDETIARIGRETENTAARLRDLCALACLAHVRDIIAGYDTAHELLSREPIDDRAVELMAPLLAVALVADSETGGDGRSRTLLAVARNVGAGRDAGDSDSNTARLVAALQSIREGHGERVRPADLLEALRGAGWEWLKSTKGVAAMLAPLGLVTRTVRDGAGTYRAYRLDAETLADLRERYSPPALEEEGTPAGSEQA